MVADKDSFMAPVLDCKFAIAKFDSQIMGNRYN